MPTTRPIAAISPARTKVPSPAAAHARPRGGHVPPLASARPTPASTANSAAERPPATKKEPDALPSGSTRGRTCTAIMPSNATPRAASTPSNRAPSDADSLLVPTSLTSDRAPLVEQGGCDDRALPRSIAAERVEPLCSLVIAMQWVVPREADAAQHLDGALAGRNGGFGGVRLRRRSRHRGIHHLWIHAALGEVPCGPSGKGTGELELHVHVRDAVR